MSEEKKYDLLIKNIRVVKPSSDEVEVSDIAIKDGLFKEIKPNI